MHSSLRSPALVVLGVVLATALFPSPVFASLCYRFTFPDAPCVAGNTCPPDELRSSCVVLTCENTPGCPVPEPEPEGAPVQEFKFQPVEPELQFAPPGLNLSAIRARNLGGGVQVVDIPWIGEYLVALYKFAVPVGAILATVVIMVAGLVWMTSGVTGSLSTAQEWIRNAIIGLVLLLGSYVVLRTINPDLVTFQPLRVRIALPEELAEEYEPESVSGLPPGTLVAVEGDRIIGRSLIDVTLLADLRNAAAALPAGVQLRVTSSYRSEQQQRDLIRRNCQNPPGAKTCNRKPGRPTTCMLTNGPQSCPHTTGRAIDAWGARDGRQCILQETCLRDVTACRSNVCQAAVIAAMRQQGFCNLASEPWHFEKPAMSSNCT